MAFLGNILLADICKAVTWFTPKTFTKHSVDILARQQARFGQDVLFTLFQSSETSSG